MAVWLCKTTTSLTLTRTDSHPFSSSPPPSPLTSFHSLVQCVAFVDAYAKDIIPLIVQELDPEKICTVSRLWDSSHSRSAPWVALPNWLDFGQHSLLRANPCHVELGTRVGLTM